MYYLAIDIGASSGRHILGKLNNGILETEEIYRFENGFKEENGILVWDIEILTENVIKGIKECKRLGKIPETVAIDTWGVDYVLIDNNGHEILPCVSYRDSRTADVVNEVFSIVSKEHLYEQTGIQTQFFNTIFQLYCDKKSGKLDKAKRLLMIPEYLSYRLTGVMKNEYTNATTTGLVNASTKEIDAEICKSLCIEKTLFGELNLPSTFIGNFTKEIENIVGFNAKVVFAPSHDTASAVAACPVDDESIYISSGTWSLIGTENKEPVLTMAALNANFTNEGGIEYRFRFLKNIMGMWLFQSIRKDLGKTHSYDELMNMAKSSNFRELIDPTDEVFLAPTNMIEAIRTYLGTPNLPLEDVLSSVYHSLATAYSKAVKEIEDICGKEIKSIHIVGGGSKDMYLNKLTAEYTGKKVYISLNEATATGNIISQIMYSEKIDLTHARQIIKKTFFIKEVE